MDGIRKEPLQNRLVLDIGCGVGGLHLTMLNEGAAHATGIDVAEGMLEKAREISAGLGLSEKISYLHGDFVQLADSLEAADITVLDKVVCCYEDLDRLIEESTQKTRHLYGLSYPRNNVLVKSVFKMQIFFLKLFRAKFHPFWHDWDRMHATIRERGFRPLHQQSTLSWNVAVFQRI